MIKQYRYLPAKENKKVVSHYILKGFFVRNRDSVQKKARRGSAWSVGGQTPMRGGYLPLLFEMRWYSEGVIPVKALKVTMKDERALNPTLFEMASKV